MRVPVACSPESPGAVSKKAPSRSQSFRSQAHASRAVWRVGLPERAGKKSAASRPRRRAVAAAPSHVGGAEATGGPRRDCAKLLGPRASLRPPEKDDPPRNLGSATRLPPRGWRIIVHWRGGGYRRMGTFLHRTFGKIQKRHDTERICIAPAQGCYARIEKCKFML